MNDSEPPILSYAMPDNSKLVRIGPFHDLLDLGMARNRLGQEGIEAHTAGENLAAALGPIYGGAYAGGGPFLLVHEADEAAARQIIADIESRRRQRSAAESPPCPACQHRPTKPMLRGLRWIGIGILAATLFLPEILRVFTIIAGLAMLLWPVTPGWKCPKCGRRFAAAAPTPPTEDDEPEDEVPESAP